AAGGVPLDGWVLELWSRSTAEVERDPEYSEGYSASIKLPHGPIQGTRVESRLRVGGGAGDPMAGGGGPAWARTWFATSCTGETPMNYAVTPFNQFASATEEDRLYLFAAPATQLISWAGIPKKGWHMRMLYQRWVADMRKGELKDFWTTAASLAR